MLSPQELTGGYINPKPPCPPQREPVSTSIQQCASCSSYAPRGRLLIAQLVVTKFKTGMGTADPSSDYRAGLDSGGDVVATLDWL